MVQWFGQPVSPSGAAVKGVARIPVMNIFVEKVTKQLVLFYDFDYFLPSGFPSPSKVSSLCKTAV